MTDLATRVQGLADAASAIHAPSSLPDILVSVTRAAADLSGAARARTLLHGVDGTWGMVLEHGQIRRVDGEPVAWPDARHVELLPTDGALTGSLEVVPDDIDGAPEATDALLSQLGQVAASAIARADLTTRLAEQEASRFREELLSGISHDMQTPLATIVGLTDLLARDRTIDPDEQHEIHLTLSRQARALRALVQQFLDFSRLESDRPLPVRARPTDVEEAIDRVVQLCGHQRELVVGVAHGLPHLDVDPDRLDQILSNLVSNAIKFSEAPVRIVARRTGGRVTIDVVDEGPGIDEAERPRLFEKFHRGDASPGTSGTGLGLYITRALVDALGGTISVYSNPGVGSRFTVSFPIVGRPS